MKKLMYASAMIFILSFMFSCEEEDAVKPSQNEYEIPDILIENGTEGSDSDVD